MSNPTSTTAMMIAMPIPTVSVVIVLLIASKLLVFDVVGSGVAAAAPTEMPVEELELP